MKDIKKVFFGVFMMTACAAMGFAQTKTTEKGAPPTASPTATSNSADFPKGWRLYDLGSKDSFKAAMPSKPQTESEQLKSDGKPIKINYFTSSSNEILTIIADIYDLPLSSDSFSEANKMDLFKKVREGLVAGMRSELDKNGVKAEIKFYEQKKVSLNNAGGYEQNLEVGPIKGRARMLSVKDHIYIFFTLLLDDKKESLMDDFLNSFEFVGAK